MMKSLLRLLSYLGLTLSVGPSFLVWKGVLSMQANLNLMAAGMLLWFLTAVFWIKEDRPEG